MGGSVSTHKRLGGGPAQGPNAARVMTGGGFIYLLVEKIDKMNKTKLPIRKWIGNVPQFPVGVDAVVAEVGTTNRLVINHNASVSAVNEQVHGCHSNHIFFLLAENKACAKQNSYQKHIDDATDVSCLMLTIMSVELQKQHEHIDAYDAIEHLQRMFERKAREE
ncbi:hypothetical protein AgCh_018158 [Apium graveolens]